MAVSAVVGAAAGLVFASRWVWLAATLAHAVVLELVGLPALPVLTWGRDEQRLGDMWNSNSLISWLLVRGGIDVGAIAPPPRGRAPGWTAGVRAATAGARPVRPAPPGRCHTPSLG